MGNEPIKHNTRDQVAIELRKIGEEIPVDVSRAQMSQRNIIQNRINGTEPPELKRYPPEPNDMRHRPELLYCIQRKKEVSYGL